MKTCEHVEMILSATIDGAGQQEEVIEAMDHLVVCENCRDFYATARSLDLRLAEVRTNVREEPMPGKLWQRIQLAGNLPGSRGIRFRKWAYGGGFLAAALLLVSMGLGLFRSLEVALEYKPGDLVDIELESGDSLMTESRFVSIAKELLESDRKYQRQMFRIMTDINDDFPDMELDQKAKEGEDREEVSSEISI